MMLSTSFRITKKSRFGATTTMWLIAHLVRGEPTFDIADRIEDGTPSDSGPWYVLRTGGWRAWPYWAIPIAEIYLPTSRGEYPISDHLAPPIGARDLFGGPPPSTGATAPLNLEELGL